MSDWIRCANRRPDEGVVVETKIDDAQGVRNEQRLVRSRGMWFMEDMVMYIYYNPTHWRPLATEEPTP